MGLQDQVAGDHHPDREAWPYRQGRLDGKRPADDLLADLVEALRRALADRLNE
jgi:hypothetical protein